MADKIQLRRDTASNWSTQNPVLSQGELGAETDTLKIKMGDSTSTWNQLSYLIDTGNYATSAELTAAVSNLVDAAPGALDTLNELAAALGDDANFATTVTDAIALKATASTLSTVATTGAYADVTGTPTLSTVATTGAYADVTGTPALAAVATSGNYSSLSGRPSIPGVLTDLSITDGTVGQVLTTDGSGGFTFDDTSGGGSFEATASGTLANGDKVIVNADGTVSVVDPNTVLSPSSVGSSTFLGTQNQNYPVAAFDSNANKVVVAYGENNNNSGHIIVGTVSGTSITFGSPVLIPGLSSAPDEMVMIFDPYSNKIVLAYSGNSTYGTAVVIAVSGSGNTATFGTPVVYDSARGDYKAITSDSNSNKVILVASRWDGTNTANAFVGTISGTSISFGSAINFNHQTNPARTSYYNAVTFDSNLNKVIVAYMPNGYYTHIRVGTISGNNISFGSEVSLGFTGAYTKLSFDPTSNKVLLMYSDNYTTGKAAVGTVSGNSISFGSTVTFDTDNVREIVPHYDSVSNKFYITYSAGYNGFWGNAARLTTATISGTSITFNPYQEFAINNVSGGLSGTAAAFNPVGKNVIHVARYNADATQPVFNLKYRASVTVVQPPITGPNLTSENFVGISDGSYASGATATIQTAGAIDDAQSGLTAGQAYFVQADGTIATTPDTPRVFAGVALSTTELMIGRDMSASSVVTYTDSDVATYLAGNGYDSASTIISTITDSAPATLDTLNELAAALGDDANFASTVTSSLALKANTSSLSTVATSGAYADVTGTPTLSTVATTGAYSDLTGTPAAVAASGSFDAVASGSLANGDKVVVNADGTISVVATVTTTPSLLQTLDNPNPYGSSDQDQFGSTVSVSGNYAIVGAQHEDDAGGTSSGKAYIYNATSGSLLHTLDNPNAHGTSASDYFGKSVAIDGNNAIVGAFGESDASGNYSGKAYIYNVTSGALLQTLDNPNSYGTSENDYFGASVAISGNYAIVTAPNEFDAAGDWSGKAYIYNVTSGALLHTIDNPNASGTSDNDSFGWAALISGNYAIISARGENKAYIFNVTSGALLQTLDNPNAHGSGSGDRFGMSVGISGNYAIVGASRESDAGGDSSGKAYIFNITSGALLQTLANPNPYGTSAYDNFGEAVAIAGNYAVVGAYGEDDVGGITSGKAYIYNVTSGALLQTIDNPNSYGTSENDGFGVAVSMSAGHIIVGAFGEDDANGNSAGKSYIYSNYSVSENLTTENFVGISDGAYASGATATIQTAGAVDNAQSGLTAGQAYFVQADGTIATTADSTRVFAGVALSATELMISRDLPADLPTGIVTADGNGDVTVAGEVIATSYNETYVALSGTTPAVDCEAGNLFSLTTSGATTFTFSNPPTTGTAYGMSIKLVAGGNHAITWPASVDWASATAPDAPASGETDMLSFITHDGGTTWYGFLAGDALA